MYGILVLLWKDWLGLHILDKLGLISLLDRLLPVGREDIPWSFLGRMVLTLVLMRSLCGRTSLRVNCTSPKMRTREASSEICSGFPPTR
ncbi:MAG: hypothetical protein Q7O66_05145 [Dehalococcoidia bacterium]|nr:hypothetical protein [Dehalococcoidia bacterium]